MMIEPVCMSNESERVSQPIRKAFTLCSVALLGATSGIETMIQLNFRLISTLLGADCRTRVSRPPPAEQYMQMTARAAPMAMSLPVTQVTRILGCSLSSACRRSS